MTLPDSLTAPEDVPNEFVQAVMERWAAAVDYQMGRQWADLVDGRPWLFVESMEYLMSVTLSVLGAAKPIAVSFSFMDSVVDEGECEVLLVWNKEHSGCIEPFGSVQGCQVLRLIDMPWPAMIAFLTEDDTRSDIIKRLIWMLSEVLDEMPKEGS